MSRKEVEAKAQVRLDINLNMLGITFTVFALIISLNLEMLRESLAIPLQLTLAIPLFLTSIFARSKVAFAKRQKMWEEYGYITFLIGYSLLINVIGIMLAAGVGISYSMLFFFANLLIAVTYSALTVIELPSKLNSRIQKDSFFLIMMLIGGVLPSLTIT